MKKTIPFTKTIHFKTMIQEVTDIEVKHNLQIKEDNIIEGDILVDGSYKMHEASQIEEKFHYNLPFTIDVDDKYNIEEALINISDFYFEIINEEDLKVNVELEISNVEEKEIIIQGEIEEFSEEDLSQEEDSRKQLEEIPIEIEENIESIEVPSIEQIENEVMEDFQEEELEQEDLKELPLVETPKVEPLEVEKTPMITTPITNITVNTPIVTNPIIDTKESMPRPESKQEITSPMNYHSIFDSISTEETYATYHVYIVRENDTLEAILEKYQTTKEDLSAYNNLDNIAIGMKIIIPCHNE